MLLVKKAGIWIVVCFALALGQPPQARAVDRDVRAVLTAGAYGIGAGTVMGLIAYPLTGESKNIFLGSAIGLFLGIAVGFYYISNRDDPENPLHARRIAPEPPKLGASGWETSLRRSPDRSIADFRLVAARF